MTGADEFLQKQKMMRLATLGADGRLHVVPVWYVYRGGKAYVGTHTRTTKARNVRATKRASFCVDVGERAPHIAGAAASGPARLITDKSEVGEIGREILLRYLRPEEPSFGELLNDTDCIIEVTVEWKKYWEF